jgi:hypothetical protein
MPDEIHANLTFPGHAYDKDPYLSICVNGNDTLGAILPRETAIELHRRINRIPEVPSADIPRCAVCNATATETSPECQVVMTPSMYRAYEKWLDSNGMYAFGIPVSDDDLPTFGIGSKDGF